MRYSNLLAELSRKGVSQKELAIAIRMRPDTLSKKMTGKTEFTWSEVLKIKEFINPELKIDYLFNIKEEK